MAGLCKGLADFIIAYSLYKYTFNIKNINSKILVDFFVASLKDLRLLFIKSI